ncbi:MAG: IclR family transcriptional regulator [Pseudomonadota bacterium]
MGKAIEVLELIAMAEQPLRFTDILNTLDQPRGTLHRQIANLIGEGLVSVNPDGTYAAGLRLLKLAARSWSRNTFRSVAEPHIRALHEATGETVHLGVLLDLEVVYIDKLESRQTVRMHSQVGNASPLYCTGIGKAMLALLPDDECKRRAHAMHYHRHTPTTLTSADDLLNEIEDIRASGISEDREEHEPGIRCVAAGIAMDNEPMFAGISVTAPAFRMDAATRDALKISVSKTAKNIERDLRSHMGPRSQE